MDVTDDDGLRTVTFDRPETMNAMTPGIARDLAGAVQAVTPADHDAVVITGEGQAFSAGGDLKAMQDRTEDSLDSYHRLRDTFGRVVEATMESRVPVVAKVNGDAVGAGLALTAVSDFAYAVESATFSCAFVKVGLVPDTGGTFLLPRLVGLRTAKRLSFTGDNVSADEAADLGLITEAVPDGELDDAVDRLVTRLRESPTRTIGLIKRAMHENLGRHWRSALDYENLVQVQAYDSPEHKEGVDAFLEGRDPSWDS